MKKTLARGVAVIGLSAAFLVPLTGAAEAAAPQRTDTVSTAGHDRWSERAGSHHGRSTHGKKSHHGKKHHHGKKCHHGKKSHHGKKHGYGKKHGCGKKWHHGKHNGYGHKRHHGYGEHYQGRSHYGSQGYGASVRAVPERLSAAPSNGLVGSLVGTVGSLLG